MQPVAEDVAPAGSNVLRFVAVTPAPLAAAIAKRKRRRAPVAKAETRAYQLADGYVPKVAQAILAARRTLLPDHPALLRALANDGHPASLHDVENAFDLTGWRRALREHLRGPITRLVAEAAVSSLERMHAAGTIVVKADAQQSEAPPPEAGSGFYGFDVTNPFAVAAAQTIVGDLITAVDDSTVDAVRSVIARAITEGIAPREAASLITQSVGLRPDQVATLGRYREGLIAGGMDAARVQSLSDQYAQRLLYQRGLLIARTETIRASVAGTQASFQYAASKGWLDTTAWGQMWSGSHDDRECRQCEALDGVTVPVGEDFDAGVSGPPLHPNCRCDVVIAQLTPQEAAAAGVTPTPDDAEQIAADLIARASDSEVSVTPFLQRLADKVGGDLNRAVPGTDKTALDFRLKTQDSLARKLRTDARDSGKTIAQEAGRMGDVLRYTMVLPNDRLEAGVVETLRQLEQNEFYLAKKGLKNTFGEGNLYRGINANFTDPHTGQVLELQFHTPDSFDLKNGELHHIYDEARVLEHDDPRLAELNDRMNALSAALDIPEEIGTVQSGFDPLLAYDLAGEQIAAASAAEPAITDYLSGLADKTGGEMAGLDFRLKGESSLARKLVTDAADTGLDMGELAAQTGDVLRYTMTFDPASMTEGVVDTLRALERDGYTLAKKGVKNTFADAGAVYRGINVNFISPTGRLFELQFHTPESFALKNGPLHHLYEALRLLPKDSPRIADLTDEMRALSDRLVIPDGIGSVLSGFDPLVNFPSSLRAAISDEEINAKLEQSLGDYLTLLRQTMAAGVRDPYGQIPRLGEPRDLWRLNGANMQRKEVAARRIVDRVNELLPADIKPITTRSLVDIFSMWEETTKGAFQDFLQEAAAERTGAALPEHVAARIARMESGTGPFALSPTSLAIDRAWTKAIVEALYQDTQERLAADGVEGMWLVRGVAIDAQDMPEWMPATDPGSWVGSDGLKNYPLSQWSPDRGVGDWFATYDVTHLPPDTASGGKRLVFAAWVPADQILSIDSLGAAWAGETVIMGDLDGGYVLELSGRTADAVKFQRLMSD